jgi:hypothetical protein
MLMVGLFGALLLAVKLLWPSPHGRSQGLSRVIVEVSIQSVIMGFGFVFLRFKPSKKYRIIVDENQMTASGGSSLPFRWSVRKGEVRTVIERKGNPYAPPALIISKHGRFGTWMLGGIWVPKDIPEIEYIEDLLRSWMIPTQSRRVG